MTRSKLIAKLAERFSQLTRADADLSVQTILNAVSDRLAAGGRVEIRGSGSFSVNVRPPRLGRNPKSGERVPVPEKSVPHFKPGVVMRELVNNIPAAEMLSGRVLSEAVHSMNENLNTALA